VESPANQCQEIWHQRRACQKCDAAHSGRVRGVTRPCEWRHTVGWGRVQSSRQYLV